MVSIKLAFVISVVIITVSISISLIVGHIMRKVKYVSVDDYIETNSTKYRALKNCVERIKGQIRVFPSHTEREIHYIDIESFDNADLDEIARQFALGDKSFILSIVDSIKKNYCLLEEYQAIDNADYDEYSEQEYENFLWKSDIDIQEYLDTEYEVCGLLRPDIPVEFSYMVSKVLYARGTDNILDKKTKSYSIFDVYKFVTLARPTQVDKVLEKQCIKECLKRDNYVCRICGAHKSDKIKVGATYKVKPAIGGTVSVDNMITVCQNCAIRLSKM